MIKPIVMELVCLKKGDYQARNEYHLKANRAYHYTLDHLEDFERIYIFKCITDKLITIDNINVNNNLSTISYRGQ